MKPLLFREKEPSEIASHIAVLFSKLAIIDSEAQHRAFDCLSQESKVNVRWDLVESILFYDEYDEFEE